MVDWSCNEKTVVVGWPGTSRGDPGRKKKTKWGWSQDEGMQRRGEGSCAERKKEKDWGVRKDGENRFKRENRGGVGGGGSAVALGKGQV